MEVILKITIPDSDVLVATERASENLPEWLREFFEWNDKDYLRDLGLGQMSIEIIDLP